METDRKALAERFYCFACEAWDCGKGSQHIAHRASEEEIRAAATALREEGEPEEWLLVREGVCCSDERCDGNRPLKDCFDDEAEAVKAYWQAKGRPGTVTLYALYRHPHTEDESE